MNEVTMDDVLPEPDGPKFLFLRDVRETKNILDGTQDRIFLCLLGHFEGLRVHVVTGQLTPAEDEEVLECLLDRDMLKSAWPMLTRWLETGEWTGPEEADEGKITLKIDPFQRETLLQALSLLHKQEASRARNSHLMYPGMEPEKRKELEQRVLEIQALAIGVEMAGVPEEDRT